MCSRSVDTVWGTQYATLAEHQTQAPTAPVYRNLFVLGALGSRGLCSAPLTAEILAAQISHEPLPLDRETLAKWFRSGLDGDYFDTRPLDREAASKVGMTHDQ